MLFSLIVIGTALYGRMSMKHDRKKLLRVAAMAIPTGLLIATYAVAGGRSNCWMTGGGSIFAVEYGGEQRITHGFVVHCSPRNSDNLEVNDHGTGWHFHMDDLTSAICIDDPAITPNPPDLMASRWMWPPRRPTRQYRASVSS